MEVLFVFFILFVAIFALVVALKTVKIVPQATVMVLERFGRFGRLASSGLNVIVPFFEKPRAVYWTNMRPGISSIDLREQFLDLPPQPVITRDNVTIHVDSVVYWQITDPIKAVYEMNDLLGGIIQLTITGMRAVMGDMDLDHTLSPRDQINSKPRLRNVAAESEAIARIAQALEGHGNPAQYLITQRYIESLRDMTRTNNSKVIFMPVETASMLSSVGAIKEMLSETGEKRASDDERQPPTRPRQLPT